MLRFPKQLKSTFIRLLTREVNRDMFIFLPSPKHRHDISNSHCVTGIRIHVAFSQHSQMLAVFLHPQKAASGNVPNFHQSPSVSGSDFFRDLHHTTCAPFCHGPVSLCPISAPGRSYGRSMMLSHESSKWVPSGKWPIEIDGLPIKNGWIFPWQTVK